MRIDGAFRPIKRPAGTANQSPVVKKHDGTDTTGFGYDRGPQVPG